MTRTGLPVRFRLRAGLLSLVLLSSMPFAAPRPASAQPSRQPVAPARAESFVPLRGQVRDVSGGALPGAVIDAIVAGRTIATTTTGSDGRYEIAVPRRVPIELRVRRAGFTEQLIEWPGIDAAASRDVEMPLGRISDTVVVTASRGAESRDTVTQSVTVATAEDIEALGSTSLADVLRFVPGVTLDGNGREGGLTALFSRGGESDYNLVLIDGVRVNLNGGGFDFSRVAAGEIERVEIVRGAQSSLWGSDAIGSVVQVFTNRSRATDRPRVSGAIEGGSFNTWRGDVQVGGGARRRVDYQAGVSSRRTDGAFADILPEDDVFEQTAFNGGIGVALGSRASLRTGLRFSRADGRSVGPIAYRVFDTGTAFDSKDVAWHATLAHTAGARFAGTATVNYFHYSSTSANTVADPPTGVFALLEGTHRALFPNGPRLVRLLARPEFDALVAEGARPAPHQFLASAMAFDFPFTSTTELRRPALRYQGDYAWAAGQRLSAGYEWERESDALAEGIALSNHAVFVQQQFSLADRWFLTVGGRVDGRENYDTFFSPRLSAGGFLLPYASGALSSVKVFANIGKGIKSPTFSERLGASYADPNPELKVERARTADVGVEATFAAERLRGSATYFDNDYRDQIAFRFGAVGDGMPEFINIDGSRSRGWELELALQRPARGFTASGMYSFVDTEVVTNISTSQQFLPGQPLLRRPKHSGAVRAAFTAGRATVHVDARFVGARHDNSFLSLRTVPNADMPSAVTTDVTVNPGYAVVGAGLEVRVHDALTVFARSDNVGDAAYESALGYPGLPRAAVAGVRFQVGR